MKNFLLTILLLTAATTQAQKQEVQKTVDTFFEAFHAKDTVKLHAVCMDKMILQSISEGPKGNKLTDETTGEFYNSIATIPVNVIFQEKLLSYNIQIDGSMAHAWTQYEFYVNGKLSHKGVNAFTLFKEKDSWKIVSIIDTRRK
ncbi:nuclear transport factor 2 family protein [Flavobacterium sp. GT3R68]|uniref:nuclear transport factor 2 family protein n=1 Tax=Flavobacterium sp. GT3R68 TaxID=2594437 RepID=UPI000F886D7C|nr:nuclear transport factor 2 family protein [Flavobacterium sp. GT3R68]RTY94949.1 nuclear transport factor 2 family protein [Flavobacterium sp. GSN2]TRW91753.1 nuclear transport factor 2 family protein [Flavobacterium sp. GT3R68]